MAKLTKAEKEQRRQLRFRQLRAQAEHMQFTFLCFLLPFAIINLIYFVKFLIKIIQE